MSVEKFVEELCLKLEEKSVDKVKMWIEKVLKNNEVERWGLAISEKENIVAPVIYLEDYYKRYEEGAAMEEIADKVWQTYLDNRAELGDGFGEFLSWDGAKVRIFLKMINYEANKRLLEHIPHRRFLDMAVVYQYIANADARGVATILINENHMQLWKASETELYEYACSNYLELMPVQVKCLDELVQELLEEAFDVNGQLEYPMYVVSNRWRLNGAASMIFFERYKEQTRLFDEDLYILPSSIHEVIAMSVHAGDVEELREIVRQVNQTQLLPEEVLSNQVYRYFHEDGKIEIA